jgi:hypothetical protein
MEFRFNFISYLDREFRIEEELCVLQDDIKVVYVMHGSWRDCRMF